MKRICSFTRERWILSGSVRVRGESRGAFRRIYRTGGGTSVASWPEGFGSIVHGGCLGDLAHAGFLDACGMGADALKTPFGVAHLADEAVFAWNFGLLFGEERGGEGVKFGLILRREEGGSAKQAVLCGILRRAEFSFGRGRAVGNRAVAASGFGVSGGNGHDLLLHFLCIMSEADIQFKFLLFWVEC
jgi:hypothetical protein